MGSVVLGLKVSRYFATHDVQYYFQVNDQYVKNKLKVVLFPFLHKVQFFYYLLSPRFFVHEVEFHRSEIYLFARCPCW